MELPLVRPGKVVDAEPTLRLIVFFPNAAIGNSVIQYCVAVGVPSDRLGVTPPERIEGGQGMLLSIPCPNDATHRKVEAFCRSQGGVIRRQRR